MSTVVAKLIGGMLYPAFNGYMNAKYLKKMHVSCYREYITLVYARVEATPVVMEIKDVVKLDRKALAAFFHSEVARMNEDEVIPTLRKFKAAAQQALDLAHGEVIVTAASVPRVILSPAKA